MEELNTEKQTITDAPAAPETNTGLPNLLRLIPALPQYQRGQWGRGTFLTVGFLTLGGAGAAEYQNAIAAERAANSDPLAILFGDQAYRQQYEQHVANQRGIGAAAFLLYLYHLFDEFYLNTPALPGDAAFELRILNGNPYGANTIAAGAGKPPGERYEFAVTFSF